MDVRDMRQKEQKVQLRFAIQLKFVNEYNLCLAMGLSQAENPKAVTKVLNSCKAGEFQSEFKTL